jgi:hypothetical protein
VSRASESPLCRCTQPAAPWCWTTSSSTAAGRWQTRLWPAEFGQRLRLHLLPPYCPDDKRIERKLWREKKRDCVESARGSIFRARDTVPTMTPSTCVLALALLGAPKCVTNDEESDCDEGRKCRRTDSTRKDWSVRAEWDAAGGVRGAEGKLPRRNAVGSSRA